MNRKLSFIIDKSFAGYSVGYIIEKNFGISSRLLSELKRNGGITLDGRIVTVREKAAEGETLELMLSDEAPSERIEPGDIPIDIIYEDEDILAVNKPKDMPVHPSIGNHGNTLANAVMHYYRSENFVFRPITRLDRDTTGVVVIAKNKFSAAALSDSMKNGQFKKTYMALLSKTPEKEKGFIDAPVAREENSVIKRCVSENGKAALTEYEIITVHSDGTCLAKVRPFTGRTHQIRVHMAHIGCPLLYDYMYGREIVGETLFLHCMKTEFRHPVTRQTVSISCFPKIFGEYSSHELEKCLE